MLLYSGPATPPNASHEGWPEWFERVGERLVDMGSPMVEGSVVRSEGTTTDTATGLNGYSIIRAADRDEALGLLKDHPLLRLGGEYAIEIFEVPRK
jgi:hypothetical protein